MPDPLAPPVRHDAAASRFELEVEGKLAVCDYLLEGRRMVFTHTFVPPELRGRNLAARLVRAALDHARAQGRVVVPRCSYVAGYIARHREFASLVASDAGPAG